MGLSLGWGSELECFAGQRPYKSVPVFSVSYLVGNLNKVTVKVMVVMVA